MIFNDTGRDVLLFDMMYFTRRSESNFIRVDIETLNIFMQTELSPLIIVENNHIRQLMTLIIDYHAQVHAGSSDKMSDKIEEIERHILQIPVSENLFHAAAADSYSFSYRDRARVMCEMINVGNVMNRCTMQWDSYDILFQLEFPTDCYRGKIGSGYIVVIVPKESTFQNFCSDLVQCDIDMNSRNFETIPQELEFSTCSNITSYDITYPMEWRNCAWHFIFEITKRALL